MIRNYPFETAEISYLTYINKIIMDTRNIIVYARRAFRQQSLISDDVMPGRVMRKFDWNRHSLRFTVIITIFLDDLICHLSDIFSRP